MAFSQTGYPCLGTIIVAEPDTLHHFDFQLKIPGAINNQEKK